CELSSKSSGGCVYMAEIPHRTVINSLSEDIAGPTSQFLRGAAAQPQALGLEQPENCLAMFDEPARALQVVAVFERRVDADGVIDRRDEIVGMHRIEARIGAVAVGGAVDLAGPHAAAGDQAGVTFGPVIAAAGADVVRRGR